MSIDYSQDIIFGWRLTEQQVAKTLKQFDNDFEALGEHLHEQTGCDYVYDLFFNDDVFAVGLYPDQAEEGFDEGRHHFSGDRVLTRDLFSRLDEMKAKIEQALGVELGEARLINVVAIG